MGSKNSGLLQSFKKFLNVLRISQKSGDGGRKKRKASETFPKVKGSADSVINHVFCSTSTGTILPCAPRAWSAMGKKSKKGLVGTGGVPGGRAGANAGLFGTIPQEVWI